MASGWNLWVWLPCIGVVRGCCCIRRYIDILTIIINFPYSIVLALFWQQNPYFFLHFFMFFRLLRIRNGNGEFLFRAART